MSNKAYPGYVWAPPPREKWFVEEVTERIGNTVIASKLRDVTEEDINQAQELHKAGKCPHNVVYDTPMYLYDARTCAICGEGRGLV